MAGIDFSPAFEVETLRLELASQPALLRKPGETLTAHDIAAWCGCSRAAIQATELRALRKVRQRLMETVTDHGIAEELRQALAGKPGLI